MLKIDFFSSIRATFRCYSTWNKTTNYLQSSNSVNWNEEQSQVLSAISSGKSVFITGSAGCGKTFLLNHIVENLREIHGPSKVFVTASTGVAACALRGQTLHAFAGVGIGLGDGESLLESVFCNKQALKRWKTVEALVIDEISMINAELFKNLEFIARGTRSKSKRQKVWGGIQLIVSGDFLQIPPVVNKSNVLKTDKIYAFEADCWNSSFDLQLELNEIFRQKDRKLVKLLQGIRRGKTDLEDLQLLKQCCSQNEPDPSIIQLYPRIEDVSRVNNERIAKLKEDMFTYTAIDTGVDLYKRQLKNGIAPDSVELCRGARVMLTKNLITEEQLVNGAMGTILSFRSCPNERSGVNPYNEFPVVKFDSGTIMIVEPEKWEVMEGGVVVAYRMQIPLVLAWAISIHKCQGMTLNSLHTDLSRVFGCGMVYVALSRVRSLEGLHLSGFKPSKIKADPKVLLYYQCFDSKQVNHYPDDGVPVMEK